MQGFTIRGYTDALIIKYDVKGNVQWKNVFGGSQPDTFNGVTALPDGGFVAVGESTSNNYDMAEICKGVVMPLQSSTMQMAM